MATWKAVQNSKWWCEPAGCRPSSVAPQCGLHQLHINGHLPNTSKRVDCWQHWGGFCCSAAVLCRFCKAYPAHIMHHNELCNQPTCQLLVSRLALHHTDHAPRTPSTSVGVFMAICRSSVADCCCCGSGLTIHKACQRCCRTLTSAADGAQHDCAISHQLLCV
jgi:hypothetical protein